MNRNTQVPDLSSKQIEDAFTDAIKDDIYCHLGKMLSDSPDLAAKVMDVTRYSANVVARVLKGLGYPPVSPGMITNHRRGTCRCKELV
jgi:hypothetical protein